MKTVLITLLVLILSPIARGQITGYFTTLAGQPVPFANVLLLKSADSSLVKATLTSEQGFFRLETVPPGTYRLRVSSLGYQTWISPVFELSANQLVLETGVHVVSEEARQLSEVVVRAAKPLYEPSAEGTTINLESSVLSKGSSVLQILERSPGVQIDYQHNSIGLNGKSGVTVLLNGKPVRMPVEQLVALLNGMSADNIEKIELLTTPGARFDAEGSAGVINLVLKKNTKPGTNGSFSVTGGYGRGEKGAASLNLSHRLQTIDLYGTYSFLRDRTYSEMTVISAQNMPTLGGDLSVDGVDTTQALQNNHDLKLGIDARLTSKTTIGATMALNSSVRSSTNLNQFGFTVLPDSTMQYRGRIDGVNRWRNRLSSFYIEQKRRDGEQLNGALDYLYFTNHSPLDVRSTFQNQDGSQAGQNDSLFAPHQRGLARTAIRVGVAKLDYVRQVSARVKLEAGLKGTLTRNRSSAGIESRIDENWVSRTETASKIVMRERIGAVYTSLSTHLNPATNLVVGVRYEHSRTLMDDPDRTKPVVDRKLGVLFPSLFLTRKVGDQGELQLSYTKRISRPSYTDLASFVRYSDPSAVYTGNPFLKPALTNNLKVGYAVRGYAVSLLFSRDDELIARYQLTESPARNLLFISPQNLTWQHSVTLQVNAPWKIRNWWEMSYSFTGGPRWLRADYTPKPVEKAYLWHSATMSQVVKLPRRFSAEVSGWYNSVFFNGTIRVEAMGALNAGIKKELKNNGGTLQLAVTDLLQTMQINVRYGTVAEEAFSIRSAVKINTESRLSPIVKLSYSRAFGTAGSKGDKRKEAGSQDERDRIQKN
ncbi:TonB-dependent receptor domain-containing protein [Larkinella bovis]|uniref:TonB-dependent receptor domain-containing protein n=1 Tax=Larkinella bovis TaxID=683041 RepID=A0ABW0I8F1_9BACT